MTSGELSPELEQEIRHVSRLSAMRPEIWRELDLTMTQFKALMFIGAVGSCSITKLARAQQMRLGTGSALAGRLVRLGLVTRRENPDDLRQTLVELAPKGQELLARIEEQTISQARQLFLRMSPTGREAWSVAIREAARVLSEEETTP